MRMHIMKLISEMVDNLPKLAWIAICKNKTRNVHVFHGSCVESQENFCAAGVWDGDYLSGDIDKTDNVAGSGIRLREDKMIFVSSGNTMDRIVHYHLKDCYFISNSFTALLSLAHLELMKEYNYQSDLETIIQGIYKYKKQIPVQNDTLHLTHFNNLQYDGNSLIEIPKPNTAPHPKTFSDYYEGFLLKTAEQISKNANAIQRNVKISIVSTLSSGYDSALVAVIAKHMGANTALTVKNSNSLFHPSDSGKKVAKALGLKCEVSSIKHRNYPNEEALWAVMGGCGDLNLSVLKFIEPVSLMLTGFHGDMIWERTRYDLTEFLNRHDISSAGFSEYALHRGVIHCAVPFWGIYNGREMQDISHLEEMKPWTLNTNYDRPTVRRIVEQAGVPRGHFALRKTTSFFGGWVPNPVPNSKNLRREFKLYVKSLGCKTPSRMTIFLWHCYNEIDWQLTQRLQSKGLFKFIKLKGWDPFKTRWIYFVWANEKMKEKYKEATEYIRNKYSL